MILSFGLSLDYGHKSFGHRINFGRKICKLYTFHTKRQFCFHHLSIELRQTLAQLVLFFFCSWFFLSFVETCLSTHGLKKKIHDFFEFVIGFLLLLLLFIDTMGIQQKPLSSSWIRKTAAFFLLILYTTRIFCTPINASIIFPSTTFAHRKRLRCENEWRAYYWDCRAEKAHNPYTHTSTIFKRETCQIWNFNKYVMNFRLFRCCQLFLFFIQSLWNIPGETFLPLSRCKFSK